MYFKVALITFVVIAFNACGNPEGPKPPKLSSNNKKLGVKVVEVIDEAPPVVSDNVQEIGEVKTVKKAPIKKKKPDYLKPEPFSLESNEKDPELLGPQSTIDTPLVRANDDVDLNSTK